jgi:formiminoglutamase
MYKATNRKIWFGRVDQLDGNLGKRWHQLVKCVDLSKEELPALKKKEKGLAILGFCCDEGVRRNQGRIGAKEGPGHLRKACSNLASHFGDSTQVFDLGDVVCDDQNLEGTQIELQDMIKSAHTKGYFVFVLGGGHEVAYPHFTGIRNAISENESIGIINIDAHFDLRVPEEHGSSGTPFYQIAEACKSRNDAFRYFVVGIQRSANTQALFRRAEDLGVTYILASDLIEKYLDTVENQLNEFLEQVDHIMLTICLDVFDISVAPGVSAPSANGIQPGIAIELINKILQSGKLVTADIAELNPSLDQDDKTSRLASKLAFEILTNYQESKL